MNEMFSQGGKGSTGILTNKQAIARKFGVKQNEVVYFAVGVDLGGYKVIYDKATQRAYSLPADIGSGVTAVSLSAAGVLVHSAGSVDLGALAVAREEYVTLPGSFDTGVTVNVKNELVVFTDVKYRWDGELPKVVPAGSTPSTTGGVGFGAWMSVGSATAVEYLNKLISFETPEKYGASSIFNSEIDDTPFVQAAIDAAEAPGGSGVVVLSRQYKLIDAPQTFKTPGDDGTVYPGWVGSGDENLPAEERPIQKFHLKILNGTKLIGLNRSCGFTGSWDPLTSPIAIEQPGMLLVTRAPGSSYLGTLTNHIANFTYSKFFVGIVFEGIIFQSRIEDLKPTYCGIAMIGHANENSVYRNIDFSGCYSGIILGGWWNFRARVSGGNATTIYVPPYDGTGGNLMGWCDGADFYNISFSVAVRPWGDRHENFDTWYNRYFYKNGNSALTSSGGRASNNIDSGDIATYSPFYGITSRAITILSRNGRGNGNNNVRKLRTNGTHRAPIFVNRSNRCTLQDAHVERSGWVDANTRTQIFGIHVQDPRRPAGFLQCTLAEGFIPLVGDYDMTASVSGKPLIPGGWRTLRSSTALDGSSGLTGSSSYPQQIVWAQDGAPYEKMLERVRMQGNNAPDPTNGSDLYIKNVDYYRMPAIYVGSNGFTLQHRQGTFTPVLYVGATLVASTSASGFYERIGDTIRCTINWYNSSVDIASLSGQISIQGMPMALTAHNGSNFPSVSVGYLTAPSAYSITGNMSGTTLFLRKQNHTAHLTASDFTAGTVAHFVQLTVEYTVASVSP